MACSLTTLLFPSSASAENWFWDQSTAPHRAEKSEDGTLYQLKFLTTPGVSYAIQSSDDLKIWTDGYFYRGLGNTITHPLYQFPQDNAGNPTPVQNPADYVPLISASLRIKKITSSGAITGLLVKWVSLDDAQPKTYTLYGQTLEDNAPPLYSKNAGDYAFFIQFTGTSTGTDPIPPNDTLGAKDAALIAQLLETLPTINTEILASTAAQAASPPPPPTAGERTFFRIRSFYTDTDQDGLQDHLEEQQGTDMWNWDTDGDGISDSLDASPLVNNAVADPDGAGLSASILTGLTGRWDLEATNSQGSYPDKTGNNHHAQPINGGQTTLGMVSRAISMKPYQAPVLGNYLSIPAPSIGSSYSLSMWIKPEKYDINGTNPQVLWSYKSTDGTSVLRLVLTHGNSIALRHNTFSTSAYTLVSWSLSSPLNLGGWSHICVVREPYSSPSTSGYRHHLYYNGKKMPDTSPVETTPLTGGTLALGKDITAGKVAGFPENEYNGLIDRVLLHNRALSAAETLGLYRSDIDRDGLYDINESRSRLWRDTNGDGQQTNGETSYTISPYRYDLPGRDHDGDGLPSLDEQNTHSTDMAHPDTDGDLMPDGWEITHGLDPSSAADGTATSDKDNDGVSNLDEYANLSDPNDLDGDSDDDGTSDYNEIQQGSHPGDARDGGQPIPENEKLTIKLGVGDKSGSESEDYIMNVFRIDPLTGEEIPYYHVRSGGHGEYKEETKSIFWKNDTYTFQIDWQSSSQSSSSAPGNPEGADFDYTFIVEPQNDDTGILIDQYDPEIKRADPANPIAGDKNDVETFPKTVENKRVVLLPVDLDVDADNTTITGYPSSENGDRGAAEEAVEDSDDEENFPGVRIYANYLDFDDDGVPGYADGIDKFGNGGAGACDAFEPMIVELGKIAEALPDLEIVFKYAASDPDQMQQDRDYYNLPDGGVLRIWKKDGPESRNPASASNSQGDFINKDQAYKLKDLGELDNEGILKLFIEAVDESAIHQSYRIVMELYPQGQANGNKIEMAVKVRPYRISQENPNPGVGN